MHHTVPALEMARAVQQNYLTPVVIFGSSSFTVDDFDPIIPVAKRSPPPTTITIRAPMRTPMTPIPPLLSAMHISSGCQLDAIQCFGCTFVPHFVRPTEKAECLLLSDFVAKVGGPLQERNFRIQWARRLNQYCAAGLFFESILRVGMRKIFLQQYRHIASFRTYALNGRYRRQSGYRSTLALNGSVANDRAARLAAIPAGESPANRGVQSLL